MQTLIKSKNKQTDKQTPCLCIQIENWDSDGLEFRVRLIWIIDLWSILDFG